MRSHHLKTAIVLNLDGLRPDMLGPYGNSWVETPQFNRLAAQSLIWETCITACPERSPGWTSLVTGRHPLQPASANRWLNETRASVYLTDCVDDADASDDLGFDRVIRIESAEDSVESPAESIEGTALGRFFAEAIDWIERLEATDLIWLDCRAMSGPWDAPSAYRDALRDPDDPEPPRWIAPPSQQFHLKSDDPDLLLGYQLAYGAQVQVLDQCLGVLLDALDESGRSGSTLLCLTATRGYPLGEHEVVGYYRPTLFKESIHVPLLVRFPNNLITPGRSQRLVQPSIVPSLVQAWLDPAGDGPEAIGCLLDPGPVLNSNPPAHVVSITHPGQPRLESIVTPTWKLIRGAGKKLFVRPDDLWEFNDVHELCPHGVDELEGLLDAWLQSLE